MQMKLQPKTNIQALLNETYTTLLDQ